MKTEQLPAKELETRGSYPKLIGDGGHGNDGSESGSTDLSWFGARIGDIGDIGRDDDDDNNDELSARSALSSQVQRFAGTESLWIELTRSVSSLSLSLDPLGFWPLISLSR